MPDRIRSGGESFMIWAMAIITASVGVPLTENRRSPCFLRRIGRDRVSEWPAPVCSSAGATTQTSSDRFAAIDSSTAKPGAWMPSSLVRRMRIAPRYADCAALGQPPAFSLQQSTVKLPTLRSVLVNGQRLNYERVGNTDISD